MTINDLIAHPPPLHLDATGRPAGYAVSAGLLRFVDRTVEPGHHTLETGAGVSTLLFAIKRAHHTAVAPAPPLLDRIERQLDAAGISRATLTLLPEASESYLPTYAGPPLDLVLIDGRHGFPAPFIDWFYTEPHLKVGGWLLVDDIQIWTGRALRQFLDAAPEWEAHACIEGRTAVFRKSAEGSSTREWNDQPFVARRSAGTRRVIGALMAALLSGRLDEVTDMYRRWRIARTR